MRTDAYHVPVIYKEIGKQRRLRLTPILEDAGTARRGRPRMPGGRNEGLQEAVAPAPGRVIDWPCRW